MDAVVGGAKVAPVPPPLFYAAALAGGLALQRRVPLRVARPSVVRPVGGAVLAGGLAFIVTGAASVRRHHTTIVPHRPVATLVTDGPYRISRNPMYTGLAFATAGASLLAGTWWPVVLLPGALLGVRRLVIDPEERYLDHRFGTVYADYRSRVRRWL